MRLLLNSCRSYRRDICLLAGGALSEPEKAAVENHLATCVDCQKYGDALRAVTVPLNNWEDNFRHIQPEPAVQRQWARAILAAARPEPVRRPAATMAFCDWWQDVIWSSRRVWTGLAAVWVVLLMVSLSEREHSPAIAKSMPSTAIIVAFKDQQKLLAELLGDYTAPPDVDRQKISLPKPRTESAVELKV